MKIRARAWMLWLCALCVSTAVGQEPRPEEKLEVPVQAPALPAAVTAPDIVSAPARVYSHPAAAGALSFSPDGRVLAAGDMNGRIWLWPVGAEETLRTLDAHRKGVRALAFSPDGKELASGGGDGWVHVWDLQKQKANAWMDLRHRSAVSGIAYASEGNQIVSSSLDDSLWVRDVVTGRKITAYFGHSANVTGLAIPPGGRCVVSGAEDRSLQSWSLSSGDQLDFSLQGAKVLTVAMSRDGQRLASATADGVIAVRRTDGCSIHTVALRLAGHSGPVRALVFSQDGRFLYSAGDDRLIIRWDLDRGVQVEHFVGHQDHILALALSPDGRQLASGSRDRTVRLWQVATTAAASPALSSRRDLEGSVQTPTPAP